MATQATLPLGDIVDIVVEVSPQLPALPTFNTGLIIGSSTHIPSWGGSNPRIRQYSSLAGMVADGFLTSDPEYISASLYFSQVPTPQYVQIGRIDQTGSVITGATVAAAGTGYAVGDILTVEGGTAGQLQVTSIGGSGAVTGVSILQSGTGYSATTEATTDSGSGSGCTVTVTVGNESHAQAAQYCQNVNSSWYGLYFCDGAVTDAVIVAIAEWAQADTALPIIFFWNSADNSIVNNQSNNPASLISAQELSRSFGLYSTTQGGTAPNNAYSGAASMGVMCGLNTGLANSAFTMMFKQIAGVAPEPLTQTQVNNLQTLNVNYYANFGPYTILANGAVGSGQFLDLIVGLDMLTSDLQYSEMNLLVSNPKIPQTDGGEAVLMSAAAAACTRAVTRGFLGAGTWRGQTLTVGTATLSLGQALPAGFITLAAPYSTQSTNNREARQAMPIYVAITPSGAVQSILIGVYVSA